jgi:hypothetical protein
MTHRDEGEPGMTPALGARRRLSRQTIIALTPAQPGWRALSAGPEKGDSWEEEIACWALVQVADDFRKVEGLVVGPFGLESAQDYEDNFIRYLAPGQQWRDFAEDVAARQAELRERQRGVPTGRAS